MMKTPSAFNRDQLATLAVDVRKGELPECPVCAVALDEQAVPPRADVSYVRDRVWLVCPSCHRTAVLDRREPGHA